MGKVEEEVRTLDNFCMLQSYGVLVSSLVAIPRQKLGSIMIEVRIA